MKAIPTSKSFVGKSSGKYKRQGLEKGGLSGGLCLLMEW